MSNKRSKSPFFIKQEFLSPLLCEQITDNITDKLAIPAYDSNNNPLPGECTDQKSQDIIIERLEAGVIPALQQHYNINVDNVTQPTFNWYPQGYKKRQIVCDNSNYVDSNWIKTKHRDISIAVFLSNFSKEVPFDTSYEVYGGKIDYPQYNFGFAPERGSLIAHPSDPHFLHCVNNVDVGDLIIIKFYLTASTPFLYNPKEFPGNYKSWFKSLL